MSDFVQACREAGLHCQTHVPLADLTTLRVGGPARYFLEVRDSSQLLQAVQLAREFELPFKVLGNGSNVLVADNGFDGLVIHNTGRRLEILDEWPTGFQMPRQASGLSYLEENDIPSKSGDASGQVLVEVEAGCLLQSLIRRLHRHGIWGLEWFAGIPASVGGAVYMNAHGGPLFFGDFVYRARLLRNTGIATVPPTYFQFDYDYSVLHRTGETVIDVTLCLFRGDVSEARAHFRRWAHAKRNQPRKSAGCIFRNLSREQQQRLALPTASTGYFIDKLLGMKGLKIGGAVISSAHAAFIENVGGARAVDVWRLIQFVRHEARCRYDIELQLEIELIGEFES